jgi:succinylglutamic semialdehyde dehydrogenase
MSRSELISTNPCTGDIVWQGEAASLAAVDTAVSAARFAFPGWAATPLDTRIAIARAYAEVVKADSEAFATLIACETGKPLWEARTEVASVIGKVDISIRAQAERAGEQITAAGAMSQRLSHRPHGVLGVLGPYNFPAHLPNGHIVPALLAGNAIVFKPSELTPAVALHMAQLWQKAGLPTGVLNVVVGARETGVALSIHEDVDGILFTGSVPTGLALHRQFAGRPDKMLALEMGGNNPLIVWDAADASAAAEIIVQSAFLSAGQRCTCARRLILRDGDKATLEAVRALMDRLIIGAPFDVPAPFMGPVISNAAADHVQKATLALGAAVARPYADRPFLQPTLVDVTGQAVPDDEIFGPVLQIIRVPDFGAAIAAANATRFGLAAGLVSDDADLFAQFRSQARVGILNWNRPLTGASSAAPFGGIGLSGNHRPSAYYAADYAAYPTAGLEQSSPAGNSIAQGVRL